MERLLKILSNIKPNIDFTKETNLVERRILTSFDILRLVAEINNEFDIEITPMHILPENFNSAQSIYALIQKLEDEE